MLQGSPWFITKWTGGGTPQFFPICTSSLHDIKMRGRKMCLPPTGEDPLYSWVIRADTYHQAVNLNLLGFLWALVFSYFTVNQEALPWEAVKDVIICTYSETWGEKQEDYLSEAKAHLKVLFLWTKIPPHIKWGPPCASAVIRHLSPLLRKVWERDGLWDDIRLNSLLGCQYYFSFTCWLSHRTDQGV